MKHVTHLTPPDEDGEYGFVCTCEPGEPYASGYRTKDDALDDAAAHEKSPDDLMERLQRSLGLPPRERGLD